MKELNNGPNITNKIRMNEYKMLYLGSKSTMQVAMSLCVEEIWDFFNNKINMC